MWFSRDQTRGDLIVTFLALLEMTRIRLIRLTQLGPLEPISIELAVSDDAYEEVLEASQGAAFDREPERADDAELWTPGDPADDPPGDVDPNDPPEPLDSMDSEAREEADDTAGAAEAGPAAVQNAGTEGETETD